jgi:hypothetical protein
MSHHRPGLSAELKRDAQRRREQSGLRRRSVGLRTTPLALRRLIVVIPRALGSLGRRPVASKRSSAERD